MVGWLAGGKFHSGRLQKKLNAKHKEDQKALYKQYYNDVVCPWHRSSCPRPTEPETNATAFAS